MQIQLPWRESTAFVLHRGPFVIASGFDRPEGTPEHALTRVAGSVVKPLGGTSLASAGSAGTTPHVPPAPTRLRGRYIDLFDADLRIVEDPQVGEGERRLLLDPTFFPRTHARLLAVSAKVIDEQALPNGLRFAVTSIDGRDEHDLTAIRLLLPRAATSVTLDGKPFAHAGEEAGTLLLEFPARARPQYVEVTY